MNPTHRPNPYPGPRPYEQGQRFYGRDRESQELRDLLIGERIVLLYSPSGAGKTSLIQAGLIPALTATDFQVLPPVRVHRPLPAIAALPDGVNPYLMSVLSCLEESQPEGEQMSLAELTHISLADYLARRLSSTSPTEDGEPPRPDPVLIFDQFEEILTLNPGDGELKRDFFRQVGEALKQEGIWALFSMREEFAAGLDPYRRLLPTRLTNRYRLDLLGQAAAIQAMQGPAAEQGVRFDHSAAAQLARDLSRVRVQDAGGEVAEIIGEWVEPVQLQVVCQRLWAGLAEEDLEIDLQDVANLGDVDRALQDYYTATVAEAAHGSGVGERAIRTWIARRLITAQGIRGQVLQGAEASDGLANRAIVHLENAHLVRAEKRRGATWYELAHDRLIEPVRADNAAWFAANLSTLQRQAELWDSAGRPGGLLLQKEALAQAEAWAEQNQLESHEQDFLAACVAARRIAQRERRLLVGLAVTSVIMLTAAVVAFIFYRRADIQARIALSRQLAAQAAVVRFERIDLSLLLNLAAYEIADTAEASAGLLDGLQAMPFLHTFLFGHSDRSVWGVAFLDNSRALLSVAEDGELIFWNLNERRQDPKRGSTQFIGAIRALAISPDETVLAIGDRDGQITLWSIPTRQTMTTIPASPNKRINQLLFLQDGSSLIVASSGGLSIWNVATQIADPLPGWANIGDSAATAAALSPNGQSLAVGLADGRVFVGTSQGGDPGALELGEHEGQVNTMVFSPNGETLATGGMDGQILLWDLKGGDSVRLAEQICLSNRSVMDPCPIQGLAYHPVGQILASGGRDGKLYLWDMHTKKLMAPPQFTNKGWLVSMIFSSDGNQLATGTANGTVILWDLKPSSSPSKLLDTRQDQLFSLAVHPQSQMLITGGSDGQPVLWKLPAETPTNLPVQPSAIRDTAFSPDGTLLALGLEDGSITLWDTSSAQLQTAGFVQHGQGSPVTRVAFGPAGSNLASAGQDGRLLLWDLSRSSLAPQELSRQPGSIQDLDWNRATNLLASGDELGVFQVYRIEEGAALLYSDTITSSIYSVALHPQQPSYLLLGLADGQIVLWDGDKNKETLRWPAHIGAVSDLQFQSGGAILASSGHDGTISIWDATDNYRLLGTFYRFPTPSDQMAIQPINELAFGLNQETLISVGDSGTLISSDLNINHWIMQTCQIANRTLNLGEKQHYIDGTFNGEICSEKENKQP